MTKDVQDLELLWIFRKSQSQASSPTLPHSGHNPDDIGASTDTEKSGGVRAADCVSTDTEKSGGSNDAVPLQACSCSVSTDHSDNEVPIKCFGSIQQHVFRLFCLEGT